MENIQTVRNLIKDKINRDIDWANPYWLDEQTSLISANQNFFLEHLLEEKLEIIN